MNPLEPPTATVSPPRPTYRVAIVGCGPSGCFTAQALRKQVPGVQIAVFDTLPTPYGLIRHGIAPDHQGAKAVQAQFDRLFAADDVHFVGNTRIGSELPLAALLSAFHATVLATGLGRDRDLGIPEEPGTRVLGAGQLLRLLNSDPDAIARHGLPINQTLGEEIAIVGAGNVAIDLARVLAKGPEELVASDIDDDALEALAASRVSTIHIIGRSARDLARWDPSMLKELGAVAAVELRVDGEQIAPAAPTSARAVRVDVHFSHTPHAVLARSGRTALVCHRNADPEQVASLPVDTVIAAVGFDDSSSSDFGEHARQSEGNEGLFRVGGAESGRLGNLAENRKLAAETAKAVARYLPSTEPAERPGLAGIADALPAARVSFADWRHIERAETERARADRVRTKFTTRAGLLAAGPHRNQPTTNEDAR